MSKSKPNLEYKLLSEPFDKNYAAQATDTVLHAPDPIYRANKLRNDYHSLWSIGGRGHLIMRHIEMITDMEEIGARLFGQMKLLLRLASVEGSG